jgi:sugar phosphate isomerase/epimerase
MFRLGATSYVVPGDLVFNARYLSHHVQDMELVLFDLEDGQSNLPSPETVRELATLAAECGLTYTVHLPLDVRGEPNHVSLLKAQHVIEDVRALQPWAYVFHLDGRAEWGEATPMIAHRWQEQAVRAVEQLARWAGGLDRLALENLEGYPLDFILPVLERVPVSRCVDIGHLWVDGHAALPYLRHALPRTRVIHLHGLAERDHASLAHTPPEQLDPIIATLLHERYTGVLTLEVFGEADFQSSLTALRESTKRVS